MSANSAIEWTEATWNPIAGCTPVSPGCLNCYAATMSHRLDMMGQKKYHSLTVLHGGQRTFNGKISFDDDALTIPLKRKKPTTYFVNSMSDLFHEGVPFEFVDKVFAVMALCPQHVFQVLTKRPERMAEYLARTGKSIKFMEAAARGLGYTLQFDSLDGKKFSMCKWPLPNVWLGASVENQKCADERIPHLLRCPAAVRFLSCEPLLGPVDLANIRHADGFHVTDALSGETVYLPTTCIDAEESSIDWVIVGGESGHNARPMHPDWARSLRDQCQAAGVPFFFKQWGEWGPCNYADDKSRCVRLTGGVMPNEGVDSIAGSFYMRCVGKKAAGRLLDGREWSEMPEVASAK